MDNFQDPFVAFERAAERKYARGIEEHRDGDKSAPFAGCLVTEMEEECLDKFCYAREMLHAGMISDDEFRYVATREAESWVWLRTNVRPRLMEVERAEEVHG